MAELVFNTCLVASVGCSCFIFFAFYRQRSNRLIPGSALTILFISLVKLIGFFVLSGSKETLTGDANFCFYQALTLNYGVIVFHAQLCLIMIDHALAAYEYKFKSGKSRFTRSCFSIAYGVPLIPNIVLLIRYRPTTTGMCPGNDCVVRLTAFKSCVIVPSLYGSLYSTIWIGGFGIIGIIASILFLMKIISRREKILELSSTSHFTRRMIARLFVAFFTYCIISFASFIPSLMSSPKIIHQLHGSDHLHSDPLTFTPCLLGICLYIMYGFSSRAIKVYRSLGLRFGLVSKNHLSSANKIPLQRRNRPNVITSPCPAIVTSNRRNSILEELIVSSDVEKYADDINLHLFRPSHHFESLSQPLLFRSAPFIESPTELESNLPLTTRIKSFQILKSSSTSFLPSLNADKVIENIQPSSASSFLRHIEE